jgi:hypothetical protein
MNLTKALLAITCAGLLSIGMVGSARHAYAQDAGESDQNLGSWSAPDTGGVEESIPDTTAHPLKIKGCWSGTVMDTGDGTGTAKLHFNQNSKGRKLLLGSQFDFEWPGMVFARGPMKGTVTATGFDFTSKVVDQGKVCTVTGSATGDVSMLTGTVVFGGYCTTVSIFQNVTFSIARSCP